MDKPTPLDRLPTGIYSSPSTQTEKPMKDPLTAQNHRLIAFKKNAVSEWTATLSPYAKRMLSRNDLQALEFYIDDGVRKLLRDMSGDQVSPVRVVPTGETGKDPRQWPATTVSGDNDDNRALVY